jgi:hypothetical protein
MEKTYATYGLNPSPERLAAIQAAYDALGAQLEALAPDLDIADCLLFGARAHVEQIAHSTTRVAPSWAYAICRRTWLIYRLEDLGRTEDAVKVITGPIGLSQPPHARLLVCALDGLLAVTWSAPSATP